MIGLLIVATSPQYRQYAKNLIASAKIYFPAHEVIVFTDGQVEFSNISDVIAIEWPHMPFPQNTLRRYHAYIREKQFLQKYTHLFALDADMLFVAPVTENDIISDGITATLHPGYVNRINAAELETRGESAAYCKEIRAYFAGGFVGGTKDAFLKLAETISGMVDKDAAIGIVPRWHDESCLQRYLYDNPPAKILGPEFCYPQGNPVGSSGFYQHLWAHAGLGEVIPKLMAVAKRGYE